MTIKPLVAACAVFTVTSLLLAGCGSDSSSSSVGDSSGGDSSGGDSSGGDSSGGDSSQDINLKFSASIGAEAAACGLSTTLVGNGDGGNGTAPDLKDFRVYVSGVQVATATGEFVDVELAESDWQQQGIALLDFEDGSSSCTAATTETRSVVEGTVPAADYSRVRFTLGIPEALNHLNQETATTPLNISGLHWSWAGGYKHARIDVAGWNIHLGTTGCTLDDSNDNLDCSNDRPNRPVYTLENVDLANSTINFDYAALVTGADISTNTEGTPSGCMSAPSDPECVAVFTNLGLDVTTGECIDGTDSCDAQTWISVE